MIPIYHIGLQKMTILNKRNLDKISSYSKLKFFVYRPRKIIGYKTPKEMMDFELKFVV